MKRQWLRAAATAALLASPAAFAQSAVTYGPSVTTDAGASLTRAEVRSQALQARDAGLLAPGRDYAFPYTSTGSTVSRASVRADLAQARTDGRLEVARQYDVPGRDFRSERTRAQVKAEALVARNGGTLAVARTYAFPQQVRAASPRG